MENLPKDILVTIALEYNLPDIINFCQTSKKINNKVCNNNDFWINKIYKDFNINFIENHKFPRSRRLRENYMKTIPARKYYLEIDSFLKKYPINDLLNYGLLNNREDLIKVAIYKDATINFLTFEIFEKLKEFDETLLNKLLDSKDKILPILSKLLNLVDHEIISSNKIQIILYLYYIVLPISSKYIINRKEFWKIVLSKLEEFKNEENISTLDKEKLLKLYEDKIDFYTKMADQ